MTLKILFYIEPVVYRSDPLLLNPHINSIRCFVNACRFEDVSFALATSPALCSQYDHWLRYGGSLDVRRFPLSARTILASYDFDRNAYSADLFAAPTARGAGLVGELERVRAAFEPDLVLSVSQNTYLGHVFRASKVVFFETGPLPRHDGQYSFFFDTGGLHRNSVLETHLPRILDMPVEESAAEDVADGWRAAIMGGRQFPQALGEFKDWLATAAGGRPVVLVATQPHDWVAIEGAYRPVSSDVVVMQILDRLPPDWLAVPTYHRDSLQQTPFESALADEFPNLLVIPDRLRSFGSDPFLPAVDAVASISSKTALTAALFGKRVLSVGQSFASGLAVRDPADLDRARPLSRAQCGRLLCFMSHRFSFTHHECFSTSPLLAQLFHGIVEAADGADYQLDMQGWTPGDLRRVMPA